MKFSLAYIEYINSPAWRERRAKALLHAAYRCQICGGAAKQVHHASYAHLGNEREFELIAVCIPCHLWVTFFLRWRRFWKWLGNKLW